MIHDTSFKGICLAPPTPSESTVENHIGVWHRQTEKNQAPKRLTEKEKYIWLKKEKYIWLERHMVNIGDTVNRVVKVS